MLKPPATSALRFPPGPQEYLSWWHTSPSLAHVATSGVLGITSQTQGLPPSLVSGCFWEAGRRGWESNQDRSNGSGAEEEGLVQKGTARSTADETEGRREASVPQSTHVSFNFLYGPLGQPVSHPFLRCPWSPTTDKWSCNSNPGFWLQSPGPSL